MFLFHPTVLKNRITDLTLEDLRAMKVRALLLDVDNTLTKHHSQELPDDVAAWLEDMKAAEMALMLVSNSKEPRVAPFAARIDLPFVHTSCKPLPFGFWRASKALGVPRKHCLAIGDQTFTDVLGAKLAGVRVAQLLPIECEAGWSFRLRRRLEQPILASFRRRATKKEATR